MKIKSKQLEENLGSESSPFTSVHSADFAGSLTGPIRFKAKNETGAAVAKGVAVCITGVSGDVPTISLADADNANMPCAGLTETSANNNAEVYIVSFGNLTGLNTAALGTGIVGDTVYISTTAGDLTLTPPTGSSSKLQNIGQIIREHATEGIIKVGGAGRTAATPNLDQGKIFIGNASNQSSTSVYTLPIADGTNGQVLTTNGSGTITFQDATGSSGISSVVEDTAPQLGGTLDLNSQAVEGNLIPSAVDTYNLGSTSAEWRDLYLGDNSTIFFGNDSDTKLIHRADSGLKLELLTASEGSSEPVFEMIARSTSSVSGPVLILNHQGSSSNNNIAGTLRFQADTSLSNTFYAYLYTTVKERTHANHAGELNFVVKSNGSNTVPMQMTGNDTDSNVTTKINKILNIADHNGTTGLQLGGTLVTTTAAELNVIDGDTSATSTTLVDADRVVVNDAGTMKQVALTDVMTYVNANVSVSTPNVTSASPSSNYTISTYTGIEEIFLLTPSSDIDVILPSASTASSGYKYQIKNLSTNTITVKPASSETIDGVTAASGGFVISSQYVNLSIVSDGSNWFII